MSAQLITYCYAPGQTASIGYDTTDPSTITSGSISASTCTTPASTGDIISTYTSDCTRYDIRAKTAFPFAYVTETDINTLAFSVLSSANATDQFTPDGTITMRASGGNTLTVEYSIFLGGSLVDSITLNPPSTHVFTGLFSGDYTAKIEGTDGCYIEDDITVNATIVTCDLSIDSVAVTDATTYGGSDGEIEVTATSTNTPIEYALNGGAYQASNTFTGLVADLYDVYTKDAND